MRPPVAYALTLWPEWAFAVAHLGKDVENRTWAPPKSVVGTRIAIHAGASIGGAPSRPSRLRGLRAVTETAEAAGVHVVFRNNDPCGLAWEMSKRKDLVIVGDIYPEPTRSRVVSHRAVVATAVVREVVTASSSPWFPPREAAPPESPTYGWMLSDVETFAKPVPLLRGLQGLWPMSPALRASVANAEICRGDSIREGQD